MFCLPVVNVVLLRNIPCVMEYSEAPVAYMFLCHTHKCLMLKHTYIFTSHLTGLQVHLHGKMTPQACSGLSAGGCAMSSGQVKVWQRLRRA